MPVVLVPVAGLGVVLGMTAATHQHTGGGGSTPSVGAPAAPASTPAGASRNADPEHTPGRPTPVTVGAAGTGGAMSDGSGATVYTFSADRPGVSLCTGACSKVWTPVRSPNGKPAAGPGLPVDAIGNMQRPDGSQQVTVYGMPIYHYAGDPAAGSAAGQGKKAFGGTWTALAPPAPQGKKHAPAEPVK